MAATIDLGTSASAPAGVSAWERRPGLLMGLARNPFFLGFVVAAVGWVYFADNYWIYVASSGLVLSISSLGLMVLVGWAKEVTLAQAAFVGCGVYVAGWLYRPEPAGHGWPFWLAVLAAMAFVGLI